MERLEQFESNLRYGLELFGDYGRPSARGLLFYSFGNTPLFEVVKCVFLDSSSSRIVAATARRIFDTISGRLSDILTTYSNTSSSETTYEALEYMTLFLELLPLQTLQGLLDSEQLKLAEELLQKVNIVVSQSPHSFIRIASILHPDTSATGKCSNDLCTTLQIEPSEQDVFMDTLQNVMLDMAETRADSQMISSLLSAEASIVSDRDCTLLIDRILTAFLPVMKSNNKKLIHDYWTLIRRWFMSTSTSSRAIFADRFLGYCKRDLGSPPRIHQVLDEEHGNKDLTEWLNRIRDANWTTTDKANFEIVRLNIVWHLIIGPKKTLAQLFSLVVRDANTVVAVGKILRSDEAVSLFRYFSDDGTKECPLLVDALMLIYKREKERLSDSGRDALISMVCNLCRRKVTKTGQESITREDVLISGEAILHYMVFPLLFDKEEELCFPVRMLQRLLSSNQAKTTPFNWSTSRAQNINGALLARAPELFELLHDLYSANEGNCELGRELRALLHRFIQKIRGDGVVFDGPAVESILHMLDSDPWYLKYTVVKWSGPVLRNTKLQVPAGLFNSLALELQTETERILVDFPIDPVHCFFTSLFELAMFEADFASELISKDVLSTLPSSELLLEKMAISLVFAGSRPYIRDRVMEVVPVVEKLCELLDSRVHHLPMTHHLSASTFQAVSALRGLLVLESAAKMTLLGNVLGEVSDVTLAMFIRAVETKTYFLSWCSLPSESLAYFDEKVVSRNLVQAYCQTAKKLYDNAMVNMANIQQNRCETRELEAANTQLVVLFNGACEMATLLKDQVPAQLKVLISQLVDSLLLLQKSRAAPILDTTNTAPILDTNVYVYLNESVASNPTDKTPVNEFSAENPLFSENGCVNSLSAAASQISDDSTRRMVDMKLEPPKQGVPKQNARVGMATTANANNKKKNNRRRK